MTTEERILAAAGELLESGGPHVLTSRAVCAAAGITAPTLYHHFGDMTGLVNALVTKGIADFMAGKRAARQSADPAEGLRRGWDAWIDFALRRPALFRLMVDRAARDPELGSEAHTIMRDNLQRLGERGALTVSVDAAARAIQAASNGVLSLLAQGATPAEVRDTGTLLFESVLNRLSRTPSPQPRPD
jgi:AcrR family transcriptional regulator